MRWPVRGNLVSSLFFPISIWAGVLIFTGFLFFWNIAPVSAFDSLITYQGKLLNSSGNTVSDGTYYFKYTIYDASSGGTCKYTAAGSCTTPTSTAVTVSGGIFSTNFGAGSLNGFDSQIFGSGSLYLGVTVCTGPGSGCDSEMSPRKQIGAAPYAYNADRLSITTSTAGATAIAPLSNNTYDLGTTSTALKWRYGNFGTAILVGSGTVTSTLDISSLTFAGSATSTIVGVPGADAAGNAAIVLRSNVAISGADLIRIVEGSDPSTNIRFIIDNAGNVGVSSSTPGRTLDVGGSFMVAGNTILGDSASADALTVNAAALFTGVLNASSTFQSTGPARFYSTGLFDGTLQTSSTLLSTGDFSAYSNIYHGDTTSSDVSYFNSRIGSSLIPTANNILDLGEFGRAWQNIYTSGTIRVGASSTISNTAIAYTGELTVSSTATTTIIGSAGSDATGNAAIILRSNGTLATADLLRIQEDSSAIPVVTINAAENFGIATSTPGASAKFGVNGDVFVGGNFTVTGTCTGCGGGAGFTDNGTTVTLTTITDKVGVGTSTPYGKLSINSETASNVGLVVSATSSQSANLSEWYDASGVLQMTVIAGGGLRASSTFQAGGEVRHYADTYLGDATTTDVTYVKSYLGDSLIPTSNGILDLGKSGTNYWNNVYSQFLITSNNQSTTTISGATLTFAGAATGTITGSPVTDGAGNAAIIIRSSSALASADLLRIQEDANATPVVTINSSENFGIATSSPGASAKLGVNGDVFIGGNITFTGACTGCGNSTGWTKSGSNVSLITGADFVGVGSSTPFGKLSVQAGADTDRVLVLKGNSATQTANLTEWYTGGGVKQMIVDPSGNLYSSSSIYSSVTSTMAALMVGPVNTSTPYAKMTIYQQNNVGLVLGQPTATSAGGDYLQVIDGNGVVYMRITTGSGSARGQLDLTGGTGAIKLNTGGLLFSDGSTIAISTNLTLTSNTALVNIPDGINQTGTGTNSFDGNSFTIGDAVTDTFTVTSRVNSSFIPSTDGDNSLGYPNLRWKHLNVGDPSYTASSGSTSTIEISTTVNGSASALGFIKGINALVQNNQGTAPGTITEVFGADILANFGTNAAAHSTSTYGIRARANYTNAPVGKIDYLYGGWFSASSTSGTGITNYGIYASSTGAATNWAGFFSGNTSLGQVTSTDITNFSSRISTSLIPVSNNQLDFGEGSRAWRDLFASGTIRVGTVINGITWNNGTFTGNASDTVGQIDTRFTIDTAQNGTENDEILRLSSLGTARLIIVATSTDRVLFRNNAFNAAGAQAYVFDTVNSFTSGTDRMLVSFRNAGTPEVSISAGGNVYANNSFIANATGSGLGDVAEYVEMAKNETAEVGDVLVADLKEPNSYRRSDKKHMAEVAGVVTDTGRFIIGSNTTGSRVPLALAGFVKVKVTDENGPIKAGDILVTSSKNGYAMKYDDKKDDSNMVGVLGVAVEDLKTVEGKIVVLIKTGWVNSRATTLETLAQDVVALGEATGVKIKTSSSGILNTSETASGTLASTSGQDLMNGSIINVKAIASASGKWSISDDGRIVSAEVVTDDVMTKKLSVKQDADKTKSTIGNATLTAGSGDVTVQNELVTDNTRVFVTFRNNPGGTYWISKQGSGYFELSVSKVPDVDAVFDYWLVDVILPEIPLTPTSTLLAAPVEATVTDTTATSTVATDTTASSTPVSASLPAPADTTSSTPIADISESPPADTASSTPISTL